jgi:hypothetical protein
MTNLIYNNNNKEHVTLLLIVFRIYQMCTVKEVYISLRDHISSDPVNELTSFLPLYLRLSLLYIGIESLSLTLCVVFRHVLNVLPLCAPLLIWPSSSHLHFAHVLHHVHVIFTFLWTIMAMVLVYLQAGPMLSQCYRCGHTGPIARVPQLGIHVHQLLGHSLWFSLANQNQPTLSACTNLWRQ